MTRIPASVPAALGLALLAPLGAQATNGYFSAGYGIQSQGVAGVGVALPQDSLAAAANPAGTALVGDRADLGLTLFTPRREAEIVGNAAGPDQSYSGNDTRRFLIPDLGYTRRLNGQTAVGIAVYGNGGMNTDYGTNPYARFGATGSAGVNLEQLFITPSVAYKLGEQHTIGAAINIAHQRFKAKGIGIFGAFSTDPAHVSDQGTDTSNGAGVRLGWIGQFTRQFSVGASWSSKINGRFDKYRGLFANQGEFDIPENYALGLTFASSDKTTLSTEVQKIRYSKVAAVSDSAAGLFAGQPLGSANGPGFGWRDMTVYKLGALHRVSDALTLRAGVSHARQPIPPGETFFNILAPGTIQNHLSIGATWTRASGEWSAFYSRGFGKTVFGDNSIPPAFGGGNVNVRLRENILGISYSWKL